MSATSKLHSQNSPEELARLRKLYLKRNRMKFSASLMVRVLITISSGMILIVLTTTAFVHVFDDVFPQPVLENVAEIIRMALIVCLMLWVFQWDDHRRFSTFLKNQEDAEHEYMAMPRKPSDQF